LQHFPLEVDPIVWAVAVQLDPQAYPQGRDAVMRELESAQIETRNGFYAACLMSHLYGCMKMPVCQDLSQRVISLPTYPTLQEEQIEFICARLKALQA